MNCTPWSLKRLTAALRFANSSSESVKEPHVRAGRAIHPLDLRILRVDHVILVGSVSAAAVAEAEVARRQSQGRAGEDVTRPRACEAWQDHGVDSVFSVDFSLR